MADAPPPSKEVVCERFFLGAILGMVLGVLPPPILRGLVPSTHCAGLSCWAVQVHTPAAWLGSSGSPPGSPLAPWW